ncbi:chain length-determining protein [Rugosibacter aromaticivorans]|uniref:Chain length-determining protein n=1 Tax=Rugosibacter aromaticivorans TaxID=1565605 RepID=A0A0C5JN76_9PROT|nr:XrtA system polysaccharide chain length determinant [Rugosibacter aromaticivorans]AJP48836.1 chain length-determining protein [Rugosibacter aromaticivorans]TBR16007.1 MAG: chain length-determining protein [Rugosibacter sp.]
MDEVVRHIRLVLRGMWLHRWLGVAVAWVVGVVAGTAIFITPDKYEASARIYVDTDSVLKPLLSGLVVQGNTEQKIAILSRTLISRPNVEKLIRMADLDLGLKSVKDKESLIDHVIDTLKIKSVGRDNLYLIEYLDAVPETARKVVSSLTTIFVESGLGGNQSDSDSARKFIDDQIKVYQQKLEVAESLLKKFRLEHIDAQLDSEKDGGGRLNDLSNQLSQARLELREAENARSSLRQQILGVDGAGGSSGIISVPEIDSRIDAMKQNLDVLLQKFTEDYPDVRGARRVIKDLEEQKKREIESRRKQAASNVSSLTNSDSVSPQLKAALVTAESQIASLRARVAEYEARYARAIGNVKRLPEVEAEYAQLNRDYGIIKKNYDELVQRRESASISEGMSSVSSVAEFRLIDPPRVSPKPVAPNRMALLPLALLASLAAGVFACFVANQVRPTFSDARTLRELTGLPLLGAVSRFGTLTDKLRERKDRVMLLGGIGSLAAVYVVAILVSFIMISQAT